ncbi:hypothetical protein [Caulobacter sp. S45]|uniref:hypothetical protein n=1 Tax=Caulobacter sp. S45 TaxID=1641861 RepID=UPI00131DE778|nr:hypothetical protein [Caulobacter sp. S45]
MAKFLESVIFSLVFLGLAAAGLWFGGPAMLAAGRDTLVAAAAQKQQAVVATRDAASAGRRQADCLREASGGVRAGRQIDAILATPSRGLVGAAELRNVVGVDP